LNRRSLLRAQAANREGPHDIGNTLHRRPAAGKYQDHGGARHEVLTADPEREPDFLDAADEAHSPELVDGPLHECVNHQQHGDE
jgi:hypothetical protein